MSTCARLINIPGPRGLPGADGSNGAAGINPFTVTTAALVMPPAGDTVVAEVGQTAWMIASQDVGGPGEIDGQVLVLEFAGSFLVTTVIDDTHVELYNLGYDTNAPAGTVIPGGSALAPGGLQGASGSLPGCALLAVNNLSDLVDLPTAQSNLGLAALAFLSTVADAQFSGQLSVAKGGTGAGDAATARTNLGAQAANALLTALAAIGPSAVDQLIYSTGVNTFALSTLTGFGRTLLGANSALSARTVMGVLPGYGLLGSVIGWDVNAATTDTAITLASTRYRVDKVTVSNPSVNLTTATGGLFTAAGGGGTAIAADQALSALTAATKFDDLTLAAIVGTDLLTAGTVYARCGTPQGAAATCDLHVYGWKFD